MRRFRHYRVFGFIPLFGWLFVQLTVTGLLGPAPVHAAGHGSLDAPTSFITICTPEGIKEIALPGAGPETPENTPSGYGGCEWCRSFDGPQDVAGPVGVVGLTLSYTVQRFTRSRDVAAAYRHDRGAHRVRAPPV